MKSTGRESDPAFDRLIARGLAREADASGNACPDADLLAAWFDHSLSALESERIEAHAAGCECCQQILAALARSEPAVIRAAPLPAPARAWHWHWRWLVPLATAVVVVVVGSHTLRAPGPVTPPSPFGLRWGKLAIGPSRSSSDRHGRDKHSPGPGNSKPAAIAACDEPGHAAGRGKSTPGRAPPWRARSHRLRRRPPFALQAPARQGRWWPKPSPLRRLLRQPEWPRRR